MIKLTFCLRRLPHLFRQQFLDYWLDTHGALVKMHAAVLNLRCYVQQHTLDDPLNEALRGLRGAPKAFDGVAELWWESREEMEHAFASPEGRAAGRELLEDEQELYRPCALALVDRGGKADRRVMIWPGTEQRGGKA